MPSLLSGAMLRSGGSGEFIALQDAQPQLPTTASSSTGYTLITNELLQTRYASSLGNIEFDQSRMYSGFSTGTITILATGTVSVSESTASGTLVVTGGVGIGRNLWVKEDIHVNDITIGRGYQGENNIVFRGTATIPDYESNNGQENIAIGYNTLDGISTAYRNIAIGRYALSSGTYLSNSIAIGDSSLKNLGVLREVVAANLTGASQSNPVRITAPGHQLTTGTHINIVDVVEMIELTTQSFYVSVITSSTFDLYLDNILTIPVDGTGYTGFYTAGGTANRILLTDNNIAIGNNSAEKLMDGEKNFFFGDNIANNLTTGSYNFLVGVDVAANMTAGNSNICINGVNLVDGRDNQINLGSMFIYDGISFTNINSNVEMGLGDVSSNPTTGAVKIIGGLGVSGSVNIQQELNVLGSDDVTLSPSGGNVYLQPTGGGSITISPNAVGSIDNMTIGDNIARSGRFLSVSVINTTSSTSTTTGALVVDGGVGVQGSIYSKDGQLDENNLLYTPKVSVTAGTQPVDARIGDFWIDSTVPAYLQYIKDGTSTFWIQVGAV